MANPITSDDLNLGYWQIKAVADLLDVDPDDAIAEVRNLKTKLVMAEKSGAAKVLSGVLECLDAERQSYRDYAARDHGPAPKLHFASVAYGIGVARGIVAGQEIVLRTESGEVTL